MTHPPKRFQAADAYADGGTVQLTFTFTAGGNGIDFTALAFLRIAAAPGLPAGAQSLADGGRITEVHRSVLPELLAMNDSGEFLNGHTPYSAYLALAAMLAGYMRGNDMIVAGNSRSDDEPNVSEYLGRSVNHQWTKSAEYEQALQEYASRWLPGAPSYCSPLRPLYELQVIRSLAPHMDEYFQTQSCNKLKGRGWCLQCAKCAWVFLATTALFGRETAIAKAGGCRPAGRQHASS